MTKKNFFDKISVWTEVDSLIKLDYSIDSPEERNELVKKILEDNPEPEEKYLEILADYLILCMEKQERKERKILTDNRMFPSLKMVKMEFIV